MIKFNRFASSFICSLPLFFSVASMPFLDAFVFDEEAYQYLDNIAIRVGTDKSSLHHDYMRVYSRYFGRIKDEPLKFLEIGVEFGASIKLWEEYFTKAELHFVDLHLGNLTFTPLRSKLHIADQANPEQLLEVMKTTGGEFDIILDDGGHTMLQQITTFKTLFPYIKRGGIYIIEDLHTSYWTQPNGYWLHKHHPDLTPVKIDPYSTVEFLKSLIDDLNYVGARTAVTSHREENLERVRSELTEYRENIESITFYDSLCFIIKK